MLIFYKYINTIHVQLSTFFNTIDSKLFYHNFIYTFIKDASTCVKLIHYIGHLLSECGKLFCSLGTMFLPSWGGIMLGQPLLFTYFFGSFYVKTNKDDQQTKTFFKERKRSILSTAVLRYARNTLHKMYVAIRKRTACNRTAKRAASFTLPHFTYFSTKPNNLYFVKSNQQLVRHFQNDRLYKKNNIYSYISAKLNNSTYTKAYLWKSPIKTFIKHSATGYKHTRIHTYLWYSSIRLILMRMHAVKKKWRRIKKSKFKKKLQRMRSKPAKTFYNVLKYSRLGTTRSMKLCTASAHPKSLVYLTKVPLLYYKTRPRRTKQHETVFLQLADTRRILIATAKRSWLQQLAERAVKHYEVVVVAKRLYSLCRRRQKKIKILPILKKVLCCIKIRRLRLYLRNFLIFKAPCYAMLNRVLADLRLRLGRKGNIFTQHQRTPYLLRTTYSHVVCILPKFYNINSVGVKPTCLRAFFFKNCYATQAISIFNSHTLLYYYILHGTFNKNIFKHAMDILRDLVQPFYFTKERKQISSLSITGLAARTNNYGYSAAHASKGFFLANLATGFEYIARVPTRLVKLAGHYLPMWRRLRQSFRESKRLRNILRQHRLTKYVARLGRDARALVLHHTELALFFVLLRSKFVCLRYLAIFFIQCGFIYVNGRVCMQPMFNIQGGDCIQFVYSYEATVRTDVLQRNYLTELIHTVFYYTHRWKHARISQWNRLTYENKRHDNFLRTLRTKFGHSINTRFSLLGERMYINRRKAPIKLIKRTHHMFKLLDKQEMRPLNTLNVRLSALKKSAIFFKNDARVQISKNVHPYNVQRAGIDVSNKRWSFLKFNVQKILDATLYFNDVPPYMEVDYLSFSIIILYLPTTISEMHKTTVFFSGYGLGKMLNWKYTT